ncbi:hypothetical protein D3C80_1660090 [compost metagenome]
MPETTAARQGQTFPRQTFFQVRKIQIVTKPDQRFRGLTLHRQGGIRCRQSCPDRDLFRRDITETTKLKIVTLAQFHQCLADLRIGCAVNVKRCSVCGLPLRRQMNDRAIFSNIRLMSQVQRGLQIRHFGCRFAGG